MCVCVSQMLVDFDTILLICMTTILSAEISHNTGLPSDPPVQEKNLISVD